jgi:hypothetical protein
MPAVTARNTGSVPIGSITTHKVIRSVKYWLIGGSPWLYVTNKARSGDKAKLNLRPLERDDRVPHRIQSVVSRLAFRSFGHGNLPIDNGSPE